MEYDCERRPEMRYSSLSPDRRRRCGNVEIARLCFWRDFQARWKGWKSPGQVSLCSLAVGPDFSTLSTARHFHSDTSTAPPQPGAFGGSAARDGGGSGCRYEDKRHNPLSPEVKS
jgi:hypothetical protein